MKSILAKKAIGMGLGIGIGNELYDYLSHGEVDWIRAIAIAVIAIILLALFEKIKN